MQLTFHNKKNEDLIKNYILNNDNSEIFEEKKKRKSIAHHSIERKDIKNYIKKKILENNKLCLEIEKEKINNNKILESTKNNFHKKFKKNPTFIKNNEKKNIINNYYQNYVFTESNKSNNDSINKSKSIKNGDKKSIISTNLTSHINSKGIINPLYRKKIEINNI
jgi:hypothetical protein